jgi:hypothetical protein
MVAPLYLKPLDKLSTAGPNNTIKIQGKMKNTRGKSI